MIALKNGETHEYEDALYEAIGVKERTIDALYEYMVAIAKAEDENVDIALGCWQEDSALGFEASMEYAFNDLTAAWKKEETQRSLENFTRSTHKSGKSVIRDTGLHTERFLSLTAYLRGLPRARSFQGITVNATDCFSK